MFMIRRNPFRGLHQHRNKQGQSSREATKIHSNYSSSSNAMQTTSLNITTTAVALITDKGGEPGHSNKALIKTNTIAKDLTPNSSNNSSNSNRTVAQIPNTTRADDLMALEQANLGHLYEPSSSCSPSTNRFGGGGEAKGGGVELGRGCLIYY